MKIRAFRHKGLERLYRRGDPSGVPAACVKKLRNMFAFLDAMGAAQELHALPLWGAHKLSGDRRGTWSLSVTRNWRLTFLVVTGDGEDELDLLNLEDYH